MRYAFLFRAFSEFYGKGMAKTALIFVLWPCDFLDVLSRFLAISKSFFELLNAEHFQEKIASWVTYFRIFSSKISTGTK